MKILITTLALCFSLSVEATIYIVAYDPMTGAMGQAVASSGPAYVNSSRFQVREHGLGLVGAGGLGLCGRANARGLLERHLGAREIARTISQRCDRAKPYYRLATVTANGEIGLHLGPQGCNSHNNNCGKILGQTIGVIGGGLKANVLQTTFNYLASLDPAIPLECRLQQTLRTMMNAGGEFKNFIVANIVVSYPSRSRAGVWQAKGSEAGLMSRLSREMAEDGVRCN